MFQRATRYAKELLDQPVMDRPCSDACAGGCIVHADSKISRADTNMTVLLTVSKNRDVTEAGAHEKRIDTGGLK